MDQEALVAFAAMRQVNRGLSIIRLPHIDPADAFHVDLLHSLAACPPDASDGDLVTAIRFVAGRHKAIASTDHVTAKNAAKQLLRLAARDHRLESKISQAAAERMVEEDSSEYWDLKMEAELAEVRATHLNDLLFALQAALGNYQTSRADDRAADRWHGQTGI